MSVSWFDGTFGTTAEELETKYPIAITKELRASKDESRIALINRFSEDSPLYALADPHLELAYDKQRPFYHAFSGNDAEKARGFIDRFIAAGHGTNAYEILLVRQDPDETSTYGYGEICTDLLGDPDALTGLLPAELRDGHAFVLPLKIYRFACPVCGTRSLDSRGMYYICGECGWEDDGIEDEDLHSSPNGATIRSYREKYLNRKKENPNYHWR